MNLIQRLEAHVGKHRLIDQHKWLIEMLEDERSIDLSADSDNNSVYDWEVDGE